MRTVYGQRVSKALYIRTLRWQHAVHSLPACDVFHNPDANFYFLLLVDCASFMCEWDKPRSTKTQRIQSVCSNCA